ncbi:MAG: hypothetical protein HUK24_04160 [Sphaerochaetaceae bacterium]|nr:hypothetical protein [Sphaerochaetaceae bacterium]
MKKIFIVFFAVLLVLTSCATTNIGSAGNLPNKWWEKDVTNVEKVLRKNSIGSYSNVLCFIGHDDSFNNVTKTVAELNAKSNAAVQISEYINLKITSVDTNNIISTFLKEKEITTEESEEVNKYKELIDSRILNVIDRFSTAFTATQFSGVRTISQHFEEKTNPNKADDIYYEGWVCVIITDTIQKQVEEILNSSISTVIDATEAYAADLQEISHRIATKAVEEILNDLASGR